MAIATDKLDGLRGRFPFALDWSARWQDLPPYFSQLYPVALRSQSMWNINVTVATDNEHRQTLSELVGVFIERNM